MGETVFQLAASLHQLVSLLGVCAASVLFVIVFRPLLVGIARAGMLFVRPRLSREERAARAQMRTARAMQRVIESSCGPSDAAELRAIAARA